MEAVIDSVIVHHSTRMGRKKIAGGEITIIDQCVLKRGLVVAVDKDYAVVHEWMRTAGQELVQVLVTKWADNGSIRVVGTLGRIPPHVGKRLRCAGFGGPIDRLLVRIALVLSEGLLVSEDSDFWDPSDSTRPGSIGDHRAPVAAMLQQDLGITVLTLPALLDRLRVQ